MAIIMTEDGNVRPEVSDWKEIVERDRRIRQLEALNTVLAAQVDRMRPVVTLAGAIPDYGVSTARYNDLQSIVDEYRDAMAALAKGEAVPDPDQLTEGYYTLAEIRLAVDLTIVEYGSEAARLHGIAGLIDKKRPELKPLALAKGEGG